MDKLSSVLDLWTKHKDIEQILRLDIFAEPDAIQKSLTALSQQERAQAEDKLRSMISAIECHLADLAAEKTEAKALIDTNLKTAKACLSYGAAGGLGQNNKTKR